MTRRLPTLLTAGLLALSGAAFAGCESDDAVKNDVEDAAKTVDNEVGDADEKATDAAEEAADDVKTTAEDSTDGE